VVVLLFLSGLPSRVRKHMGAILLPDEVRVAGHSSGSCILIFGSPLGVSFQSYLYISQNFGWEPCREEENSRKP
jgi:hypothetical protein